MTLQADPLDPAATDADAATERMLTALAHELRTPLTAIRGFAALLESLDAPGDEGARREITERLIRNTIQMEALLDSMLDAARDHRVESLSPQVINLHAIVLDVVDAVRPALGRHTVNVHGAITYAYADPYAVTRVLTCLLTNAACYSPNGSRIDVATESSLDGWARMTISDAGPGIPPPDRANVFVPFWRGERARQDVRGLGVGLSIAQDLCVRSGGNISVREAAEGGAEFVVVLPRH